MTTGVPNRLMTRAAELSKAGKHAEAIAEAKKALEINPRAETLMYGLAKLYAAAGDTKLALEQLSMAIARQPKQWKFEASTDPAFEKLRALPEFQRLIKPLNEASRDPVARPAGHARPTCRAQTADAARAAEDA